MTALFLLGAQRLFGTEEYLFSLHDFFLFFLADLLSFLPESSATATSGNRIFLLFRTRPLANTRAWNEQNLKLLKGGYFLWKN